MKGLMNMSLHLHIIIFHRVGTPNPLQRFLQILQLRLQLCFSAIGIIGYAFDSHINGAFVWHSTIDKYLIITLHYILIQPTLQLKYIQPNIQ